MECGVGVCVCVVAVIQEHLLKKCVDIDLSDISQSKHWHLVKNDVMPEL